MWNFTGGGCAAGGGCSTIRELTRRMFPEIERQRDAPGRQQSATWGAFAADDSLSTRKCALSKLVVSIVTYIVKA